MKVQLSYKQIHNAIKDNQRLHFDSLMWILNFARPCWQKEFLG